MINPITVIIADDEAAIRHGLAKIVTEASFAVRVIASTDNGRDALSLLLHYQPDIAIIDINMPELNGLEVIRQSRENQLSTSFLILSGYADFSYAQTAIRYGVKSYFLKPLKLIDFRKEFEQCCQEILDQRSAEQNLTEQELSSLMDASRILFLNWLIGGRKLSDEDIQKKLSMLTPSISDSPCRVIVFFAETIPGGKKPDPERILELYLAPALAGWPAEIWIYNGQPVAIVNLTEAGETYFMSVLEECLRTIQNREPWPMLAGIGDLALSLNQCSVSYSQAQEALTWHIYHTGQLIFDTSLIHDAKPSFSRESFDFKPIVHAILHQDEKGIRAWCQFLFHKLMTPVFPPPNYLTGMCMYTIVNVQKQVNLLCPEQTKEFIFSYEEISAFDSVSAMEEWLTDFFVRYSKMIKAAAQDANGIIRTAKEYIRQNLGKNLHARDVAARVNLSESYFSIYFKEKTGTNFRDYVLKARMDYAKARLLSGQANISEIAYETGYQDYRSFSRAFKNETGMSPSEYMSRRPDKTGKESS